MRGGRRTARPRRTLNTKGRNRVTTERVLSMLSVDTPVMVRVASRGRDGWRTHEYTTRVEELEDDSVVVSIPAGANSALLASGTREVDLAWLSPRGRYEQPCRLEPSRGRPGSAKSWRLRPLRLPLLIQRRRYVRVRSDLDVRLESGGNVVKGMTIDISEGGFRIRLPRRDNTRDVARDIARDIAEFEPAVVHAVVGNREIAIPGRVLRTTDAFPDSIEAVVAFEAGGRQAEEIRSLVLNAQLRARAAKQLSLGDPSSNPE